MSAIVRELLFYHGAALELFNSVRDSLLALAGIHLRSCSRKSRPLRDGPERERGRRAGFDVIGVLGADGRVSGPRSVPP